MMTALILSIAIATPPPDVLTVSAHIEGSFEVGSTHTLHIQTDVQSGWSDAGAGMPHAILQLEVPDAIELKGPVLQELKALSRNEFLNHPFERFIKNGKASIEFELRKAPPTNTGIKFNVCIYVSNEKPGEAFFVRQRYAMKLEAGAKPQPIPSANSSWNDFENTLELGQIAAQFELPTANNERIALQNYIGKKNIVITTYRAFW